MRAILNKFDKDSFINIQNKIGSSALYMSAYGGYIECQRLLLDKGTLIDASDIEDIEDQEECKKLMIEELQHRSKRIVFDRFINHYIEYKHYRDEIYLRCYPSGDLRIAVPLIGWSRAEEIKRKFYFDEILYYVHLNVAKYLLRKLMKIPRRSFSQQKMTKLMQLCISWHPSLKNFSNL